MPAPLNPNVLRLIDANANRAREALRVVEDYARMVLNHGPLTAGLKSVRHDLTTAIGPWLPTAALNRDVAGDVGTTIALPTESARSSVADVVTAAGKRFGEAARSIEEYAKTFDPMAAAAVESVRYRFYGLEQQILRTLRPSTTLRDVRLYVLITESACRGDWFATAQAAIAGGADALQLREKTLEGGEMLRRAKQIVGLCHDHGVLSIINDRLDVAILSDADGVHVGQGDLPAAECRRLIGPDKIVGVSTHEMAHAAAAVTDGADYIGVGPVYRSPTKPRDFLPGLDYARAAALVSIPTVAIAGITIDNAAAVAATGVTAIAVTSAVTGASDVADAARRLKSAFTSAVV